jgi:methionyl-tRNA formyltransferase
MRVLFWGTPWFAVPTLRALSEEGYEVVGVVTQPDRPAGRGRQPRPSPVKELAMAEGIPVLTPDKPRGLEFEDRVRALSPDISVVVAYGHILHAVIVDLPPKGSVNVHASLLPELRGAAPVHWAIARGHPATGVTVMRMVEAMDAGPILLQMEHEIGQHDTSTELSARLSELGAQALIETLALLEVGTLDEVEQDHERATYAPKVDRETARVVWDRPAVEVANHIRAMDEMPGAWSDLNGAPVKLFRPLVDTDEADENDENDKNDEAEVAQHGGRDGVPDDAEPGEEDGSDGPDVSDAEPGTVLGAATGSGRGIRVACGEGAVWIGEVQPAGKRRMSTADWLRGRALTPGERFD